jgi:hypothetical protein
MGVPMAGRLQPVQDRMKTKQGMVIVTHLCNNFVNARLQVSCINEGSVSGMQAAEKEAFIVVHPVHADEGVINIGI